MRQEVTDRESIARPEFVARGAVQAQESAIRSNARPPGDPDRRSYPCGVPPCRIYQPSPTVMQSGGRHKRKWVLEFEPASPRRIEPLMGWTASEDPFAQIRLTFPDLSSAVDYAERQGLDYQVVDPPARRGGRGQSSNMKPERGQTCGQAHGGGAPYHDCLELMMMQR
jgi:hypothetical protein